MFAASYTSRQLKLFISCKPNSVGWPDQRQVRQYLLACNISTVMYSLILFISFSTKTTNEYIENVTTMEMLKETLSTMTVCTPYLQKEYSQLFFWWFHRVDITMTCFNQHVYTAPNLIMYKESRSIFHPLQFRGQLDPQN